ncbi:MAG: right-handed parallel beta-helix repeat-containing protein, partial [Bacteroidota bacterium]
MANTYYVRSGGDDTANGLSIQQAWQSLERVNQQDFQPGDTILLAAGAVFNGNLTFEADRSGTLAAPLTLSSYGEGRATIWADSTTGILVYNTAGIRLENVEVVGNGRDQNDGHGIIFYLDRTLDTHLEGVWLNDIRVRGFNRGGITFYANDSAEVGFSHIRIQHIESYENGDHGIGIGGKVRESGHVHRDIKIRDCIARDNPGQIGKTWSHTGNGIVVGNSEEVLIEYCQAYRNGRESFNNAGGPVGIWLWDTRAGTIQHCESHHNDTGSTKDGGGFDLDGGCQDCTIQYCYAHDNAGPGYLFAEYNGARPLRRCQLRFNISENDGRKHGHGALVIWKGQGALDSLDIYHNTFYCSDPARQALPVVWITSSGLADIRIFNNVIMAADNCLLMESYAPVHEVSFTGNAYHSEAPFEVRMAGQSYVSLAAWQGMTGAETWQNQPQGLNIPLLLHAPGQGGTLGDPYRIPDLTGYRPLTESPLREAAWMGHNIDPGMQDVLGQSLPTSALDIGAVQYAEGLSLHLKSRDSLRLIKEGNRYRVRLPDNRPTRGKVQLVD